MSINFIPGSEVLGWGFNIFGSYSADSKTRQMFQFPDTGQTTQPLQPNGTVYLLPGNVQVINRNQSVSDTQVFESRSHVEDYFSAQAGMSTRLGEPGVKFSGQFDAMFSGAAQSDTEYMYGMVYSGYHFWDLEILEQSIDGLAPWVLNDPDFYSLPREFNEENASIFFRFFDKYGTHYVSSVKVGWKLYFNEAVERSYTTSSATISANMNMEFRALFLEDDKVSADATWSQVGYEYTQNRMASVLAQGGDSSIVEAALPGYGASHSSLYDSWRLSAEANPVAVDFGLSPMWYLFSGNHATALEAAYVAYSKAHLYAEAKTFSSLIQVKGAVQNMPPRPTQASGFQVVVLDRSNLETVFKSYFTFSWNGYWNNWPRMYDEMYVALSPYNSSDYIVSIASFGMMGVWFPTDRMYQFLVSCGASEGLRSWERLFDQQPSANYTGINYILVGVPQLGMGNGLESYTEATGGWSRISGAAPNQYWTGYEAPAATLLAQLRYSPRTGQVDLLASRAA
jgi:hypothetical protein